MAMQAAQSFRPGDTRERNGWVYERQADGRWMPVRPTGQAPAAGSPALVPITGPRAPSPQTPAQQQRDALGVQRDQYEVQTGPADVAKAQADAERARIEADNARRAANAAAERPPAAQAFSDENALRNNFRSDVAVRRYLDVLPAYHGAMTAADNRAGDLNLVYALASIMDPGSVVREGEMIMARNAGTLPEQVQGALSLLGRGGELTPELRDRIRTELRTRGQAIGSAYNQQRQHYAQLAQRYGFDPQAVIGPHPATPLREEAGLDRARPNPEAPSPLPEGDVGFSGREFSPLTAEQFRAYDAWMSQQRRGELTPQQHAEAWQRITGTPATNSEEVARVFNETGQFAPAAAAQMANNPDAERLFRERQERDGPAGSEDLLFQGATLGLTDEAGGVGQAIVNAARSPFTEEEFDPAGAYVAGRDAHRMRLDQARERTGWLGTGAEILGGFASGRVIPGGLPAPAALPQRMLQGSRMGAEVGALAGYGYGEGAGGSTANAFIGAAGGGVLGGAIPAFGAGGSALINLGRTAAGRNPNLARRAIAEAIQADNTTPALIGQQMQEAGANGVPMMLADTGENVRGLLAASSRAPGAGRTLARDALDERQSGLAERVAGAIERDLGPASNPHEVSEQLIQQAQTAARPLYDAAYARPGADTFARRLGGVADRPAMRQAMNRAARIAQEEGREPTTMGFEINSAGEVTSIRTPSWQTWDYVKRGIDDVLQAQPRDPATGRVILDEGTRAIEGTRKAFLSAIDSANPEYAQARAAWAGPVQARDAMNLGRRVLNLTADDLSARTKDLSPNELEFLRLGARRAMAERIANLGDTANVTHALLGTGRKRTLLLRLFGGRSEFNRFVSTLEAEQAGFQTYRTARLGSPTAPNLQDDTALNVATAAADFMTTGTPVMTGLRQAVRLGTGRAGDEAKQQIAAMLSEMDPARLAELARELAEEAARRQAAAEAAGVRASGYGRTAGQVAGMIGLPER